MTPEQISRNRALAIMFSQASGQRVMAEEVCGPKDADLAASYHRTAELLNILARRAPEIWADEEQRAVLAATSNGER